MRASILLLGLFFFSHSTFASLRSAQALKTNFVDGVFTSEVGRGFHFNLKASNEIRTSKKKIIPLESSDHHLRFPRFKPDPGDLAVLYVCDDAATYCETHKVKIKDGKPGSIKAKISSSKKSNNDWQQDLPEALKKAKQGKKLILAEFSAKWCPGCARLEQEIFSLKEFGEAADEFVLVHLDVDQFENFSLVDRYSAHSIPALLVLNANGEEINRIVDYQPKEQVLEFLSDAKKDPRPIIELRNDKKSELALGRRLLAAGQFDDSISVLEKIAPAPAELLSARIYAARSKYKSDEKTKLAYMQTLREAIQVEPESTRSILWRATLAGLLSPEDKERRLLVEAGEKLTASWLKNAERIPFAAKTGELGEYTGIEKLYVSENQARLVESAALAENEVQAAWDRAVEAGRTYKISPGKIGPAKRFLMILLAAKKYEEAEAWTDLVLKEFPSDFDFRRRKMSTLFRQKKYEEAVAVGLDVLPEARGSAEMYTAEVLIKSYIGAGRKEEARILIEKLLSKSEMKLKEMKEYEKKFLELRKTL